MLTGSLRMKMDTCLTLMPAREAWKTFPLQPNIHPVYSTLSHFSCHCNRQVYLSIPLTYRDMAVADTLWPMLGWYSPQMFQCLTSLGMSSVLVTHKLHEELQFAQKMERWPIILERKALFSQWPIRVCCIRLVPPFLIHWRDRESIIIRTGLKNVIIEMGH